MRVIDLKRELEKLPDHAAIEVIEDSITITYQVQAHTEVAVGVSCAPITKERIENLQKVMYEAQRVAHEVTGLHKQNPYYDPKYRVGDIIAGVYTKNETGEILEIGTEGGLWTYRVQFPGIAVWVKETDITDLLTAKQNQATPEEPKPFKRGDPITIEVHGELWHGTYNQKINEEWSEIAVKRTNDIWEVLTEELKHAGEQP